MWPQHRRRAPAADHPSDYHVGDGEDRQLSFKTWRSFIWAPDLGAHLPKRPLPLRRRRVPALGYRFPPPATPTTSTNRCSTSACGPQGGPPGMVSAPRSSLRR
ncbi:hypothetical protein FRAHR75_40171 [Frankia sp. Hr75.2]|nr:hypothetical protein FRAHR75_40171 [Frankia sp. Hr75.2]